MSVTLTEIDVGHEAHQARGRLNPAVTVVNDFLDPDLDPLEVMVHSLVKDEGKSVSQFFTVGFVPEARGGDDGADVIVESWVRHRGEDSAFLWGRRKRLLD